jgi:HCOMODA/2-hydroxy-3-carboxy-muconic semialdehyde decarboxylase
MSAFLGGGVPVFDIRDTAGMTDMLVKTPPLGSALARTLGARPVVLMRGHGCVAVGPTLPHAVFRSVYLDMNAKLQAQAMALEAKQADVTNQGTYGRPWELWKRRALAR